MGSSARIANMSVTAPPMPTAIPSRAAAHVTLPGWDPRVQRSVLRASSAPGVSIPVPARIWRHVILYQVVVLAYQGFMGSPVSCVSTRTDSMIIRLSRNYVYKVNVKLK